MKDNTMIKTFNEGLENIDDIMLKAFTNSIVNNFWQKDNVENTLTNTYAIGYQQAKMNTYKEHERMNKFVESLDSFRLMSDVDEIAKLNEIYATNSNNLELKSFLVQRLVALCVYLKDEEYKFNKKYQEEE